MILLLIVLPQMNNSTNLIINNLSNILVGTLKDVELLLTKNTLSNLV